MKKTTRPEEVSPLKGSFLMSSCFKRSSRSVGLPLPPDGLLDSTSVVVRECFQNEFFSPYNHMTFKGIYLGMTEACKVFQIP